MAAKKPPITRVRIAREELEKMSNEDFLKCWALQEQYVDHLENKLNSNSEHIELLSLRESDEKLKQQQLESTRRENILVMRLTTKEQEMQEYAGQIQELKQAQVPSIAQLRSALLDPAVNLLFERMRKEMDSLKARLEETQNELSAWKFTPDSNTGKRLMAKCRLLYQENEELGKIISSGRMAKLEGDLALQKSFSEEMKKSQSELDEFLLELDEDVEGMQSTIYYLQQQLRESKDQISQLQKEKQKLSGIPNGSPSNHRLIVPDDAMDTDSQSSHLLSSLTHNNLEPESPKSSHCNELNGTKGKSPIPEKEIKSESRTSSQKNQVIDKTLVVPSKKVVNEPSTKIVNEPSTKVVNEPSTKVDNEPSTKVVSEPSKKVVNEPSKKVINESSKKVVNESSKKIINEPSKKVVNNEASVILSPKDIKQEIVEPSTPPESNAQSVIVENKTMVSQEKQTPLVERTNTLVDGLEATQDVALRTSEQTTEVTASSEEVPRNSANSKRTEGGGRGRKRTRPRTPVEPEDKKEANLPVRKRTRRREALSNEEKKASLEIDTDTEVQVAQTLAYWASAKQERTEVKPDGSGSTLGNGELAKKENDDK